MVDNLIMTAVREAGIDQPQFQARPLAAQFCNGLNQPVDPLVTEEKP
ncbi:hypothetical protein RAA17_03095 [Komagataeibacter rhaeticus]|nr:hypothetical protein [Komagataeibacter rhaeticus]